MTWKGSLFDTCCYTVRPVRFLVRHYGIEPGFEWLLYVENLTKDISTFEKFEGLSIQLDFFLQVLFKDEFNFSMYFGWLNSAFICSSNSRKLTCITRSYILVSHQSANSLNCGRHDAMLSSPEIRSDFYGKAIKAISLHSNFSTFWVESHFMGYMLTLSIQLKV